MAKQTQHSAATEAIEFARGYEGSFEFMQAMRKAAEADRPFSRAMIDAILRCKARQAPAADSGGPVRPLVSEPGMYRTADGQIWKVQRTRDGRKHLYAKKLVQICGRRLNEADDIVRFEFQYDAGAVSRLQADDRMSLDEAKAFGIRYGVCCVCGAWLKDATSVELGIGPVCGRRV